MGIPNATRNVDKETEITIPRLLSSRKRDTKFATLEKNIATWVVSAASPAKKGSKGPKHSS
jgi:hypothetical protein